MLVRSVSEVCVVVRLWCSKTVETLCRPNVDRRRRNDWNANEDWKSKLWNGEVCWSVSFSSVVVDAGWQTRQNRSLVFVCDNCDIEVETLSAVCLARVPSLSSLFGCVDGWNLFESRDDETWNDSVVSDWASQLENSPSVKVPAPIAVNTARLGHCFEPTEDQTVHAYHCSSLSMCTVWCGKGWSGSSCGWIGCIGFKCKLFVKLPTRWAVKKWSCSIKM